jgi:O-antigen/teichoic acid export membrane protein
MWNLFGMGAPLLVALFAIPLLIDGFGKERFGLLAIIWMGVGYFSLFDFGLGRALTKLVAERLGSGDLGDLGRLIWTGLIMLLALGFLGGVVVWLLSDAIVSSVLNVEPGLRAEAITSFRILALGLPVVVLTSALIGILEAYQRFRLIAAIRVPLGVLTFAGPLLTLQFTPSLTWATIALLGSRLVALVAYYFAAASANKALWAPRAPDLADIRPLVSFGGWQTATNIVGPLMTYLDRFVVGALLNLKAVTFYVAPYEAFSRIQILPQALMGVVFPAFSTAAAGNQKRLASLYADSCRFAAFSMLPIAAAAFLFAPEILALWLGQEFAVTSAAVVKFLAIGCLANTLARLPFTALQGTGRPDLVALTHLAELLPYLAILWWATVHYGIAGAALAWTLRATIDALILNEIAGLKIAALRESVAATRVALVGLVVAFAALWALENAVLRVSILAGVAATSTWFLWPFAKQMLRKTPVLSSAADMPHRAA